MSRKIMIVTGEASGDLHGSNLVRALKRTKADFEFYGMGGPELASLGVEILFDAAKVSVVGALEVFSHLQDIVAAQRILRRRLREDPPDLLILIDLPDFNLMLAKVAKKIGVPVFYYISPQLWAWRSGRVKTIKSRVDKIGVILPFEEEFYRARGVHANYVGHPLLDTVETTLSDKEFRQANDIPQGVQCIGLLPGSRKREVSSLLPVFLAAAEKIAAQSTQPVVFLIPKASTIDLEDLREAGIRQYENRLDIRVVDKNRYEMMAACDGVVTASGTVTLELAILNVPMVVTYRLSPLTYRLGRLLIKIKHFSLVNLIAGYTAVPELLQDEVTEKRVAGELLAICSPSAKRDKMIDDLRLVNEKLGEKGASEKAAAVVLQMLDASTS